ncbi:MAG TPA: hypothetical protein ENN21_07135 [Spirochaetes bacterium]|nr:hypothetical protein [Spirochaetota bacterium]
MAIKTSGRMLTAAVLALALACGCSKKYGILHEIRAAESSEVEIKDGACGLIRTRFLEVSVEPIPVYRWKQLLAYPRFNRPDGGRHEQRIPKLFFFQMVLHNVSDAPVPLGEVAPVLVYDGAELAPLSPERIKKDHGSPAYDILDFDGISGTHRLIAEKNCVREIDYRHDLIEYRLNFINPGDRLLKIVAFPWMPVEKRNFTVRVGFPGGDTRKTVGFGFHRSEYRARGGHFTRPAARDKELNQ